ncbi:MAG: hypothetical protein GXY33_14510 [Phycisphaerae bacterium]|nr:hypothetical protein [Phycisphaerae bacterium]
MSRLLAELAVLILLGGSLTAAQTQPARDWLGMPPDVADWGAAVKVPFVSQIDRKALGEGAVDRLWDWEAGVNFMTDGSGEGLEGIPAEFAKAGEYRVLVRVGAGWAKGAETQDRFVLGLDGQPVAIWAAKGTGGASDLEWTELQRVAVDKPGTHSLTWRHVSGSQPRTVQYLIAGLVFVPAEGASTTEATKTLVSEDGWIRGWLVGGTFGMGGLASIAPFYEKYFLPIDGLEWDQYALDGKPHVEWKPYVSPTDVVRMDLPETFEKRGWFDWPVGRPGCAYASLYVKVPSQMDVLIDFDSSQPADLFHDGDPVVADQTILGVNADGGFQRTDADPPLRTAMTLHPGVNRLTAKLYFPQNKYRTAEERGEESTWFKCRILDIEGNVITGQVTGRAYAQANASGYLLYSMNPHDMLDGELPPGRRLGDLVELNFETAEWSTYLTGQDVNLTGTLGLTDGLRRLERYGFNERRFDDQENAATVHWVLHDFDGNGIARDRTEVSFTADSPGRFGVPLGKLPRGHYTLYTEIRSGTRFVCQPQPEMIVVVDPPTLPRAGVHSKFAHSFYYIFNSRDPRENESLLRLLALAKVRWNIGSAHKWWIDVDPRQWADLPADQRTWPRHPRLESVDRARQLGIEIIGQLGAFTKGSEVPPFAGDPNLADHLIINDYFDFGPIDSPEIDRVVDTYVFETVSRFKEHFRYWRLDNEMNLRDFTPAELVRLHELVSRAMRRADPEAKLWMGSISSFDLPHAEEMLRLGLDRWIDVYDYHYYIWPQPDPTYADMGGLPLLLSIFERYGVTTSIANGEFGCYRSIHKDGARVQAAMLARGLIVAHTYDQLRWIAPHFPTHFEWCADAENGMHACYLAYRTAADILEGAAFEGTFELGDRIAAYRFKRPSGSQAVVLWDEQNRRVTVPGIGPQWRGYDMLGRPVRIGPDGEVGLSVFPLYLTDGQLEEGGEPSPL